MLERITNAKCFNLFSLLVMLHITMGMPLVHPFVHAHLGHDEPIPVDNGHRFQNHTDQGETHRCPICDFQATNQLHAAVNNVAHTGHHYTDRLIISASSLSLEAAPQHYEARAPPHFPAVSK
jgi:hypothetical protein